MGLVLDAFMCGSLIEVQEVGHACAIEIAATESRRELCEATDALDTCWMHSQGIADSARIHLSMTCRRSLIRECGGDPS